MQYKQTHLFLYIASVISVLFYGCIPKQQKRDISLPVDYCPTVSGTKQVTCFATHQNNELYESTGISLPVGFFLDTTRTPSLAIETPITNNITHANSTWHNKNNFYETNSFSMLLGKTSYNYLHTDNKVPCTEYQASGEGTVAHTHDTMQKLLIENGWNITDCFLVNNGILSAKKALQKIICTIRNHDTHEEKIIINLIIQTNNK